MDLVKCLTNESRNGFGGRPLKALLSTLGTHCLHLSYIRSRFARGKGFLFNARNSHNRFRQDKMTSFPNNFLPSFFHWWICLSTSETSGPSAQCTVFQAAGAGYQSLRIFPRAFIVCVCLLQGLLVIIGIGEFGVFQFRRNTCGPSLFYPLGSEVSGTVARLKCVAEWQKKSRVGHFEQIITSAVSSDPCVDRD